MQDKEFVTQAEMLDTEESTIFAAPKEHTDKIKKNASAKKIIAAVLAVVILATGTFCAVKFIPKMQGESVDVFEQGTLFSHEAKYATNLTVKSNLAEMEIKGELIKESIENSVAQTRRFTLLGYDNELLEHENIAVLVQNALVFKYYTYYETTDLAEYGLDNPEVKIKAVGEGFDYEVHFGKTTPDTARCYAWTSVSPENVFVVSTTDKEAFLITPYNLAITSKIPAVAQTDANASYFADGTLETFDTLVVSGSKIKEKITIKPNTDEKFSALATYITTTPRQRIADDVESILKIYKEGLDSSSAVSFDQSAESLKKFSLDNPEFMLTLRLGKEVHTFRFTQTKENQYEYYVAASNDKMIRTVSVASIEFVNREEKDYYILFTVLESITDLNRVTVSGEVNADFKIDYDTEEEKYIIKNGDKDVAESVFKTAYQDLIATVAIDIETVNTSKKPSLTVKLYHKDGSAATVLSFTKVSETRYQYSVGGVPMGQVTATGYNTILKSFKKAAE